MCGAKIAVQTGTTQEDDANDIAKGCKADNKAEVLYKRQAEAAAVATGKAGCLLRGFAGCGLIFRRPTALKLSTWKASPSEGIAIEKANEKKLDEAVQKVLKLYG